jgi:hypothetical protein
LSEGYAQLNLCLRSATKPSATSTSEVARAVLVEGIPSARNKPSVARGESPSTVTSPEGNGGGTLPRPRGGLGERVRGEG